MNNLSRLRLRLRHTLTAALFLVAILSARSQTNVTVADFAPAFGSLHGTLTYLDYTSGKPFTMPANVTLSASPTNDQEIILALEYPKEPKANGNATLLLGPNGATINDSPVISRQTLSNESLQITTEEPGRDGNDNKKATLKHIYTISKTHFSNRKEVKFDGTDQWILRNEYTFSR